MTIIARIEGGNLAEMVIGRFGGMRKMELVAPFTYDEIRNMRRRGNLTEEERAMSLRAAHEAGVNLTPWDFIKHLVAVG